MSVERPTCAVCGCPLFYSRRSFSTCRPCSWTPEERRERIERWQIERELAVGRLTIGAAIEALQLIGRGCSPAELVAHLGRFERTAAALRAETPPWIVSGGPH